MPRETRHGTPTGYTTDKCRCPDCREAQRVYHQEWRARRREVIRDDEARELLRELLNDVFPFGLTDDCPARKAVRT